MTKKILPDVRGVGAPSDVPVDDSLSKMVGDEPVDLISLIVDEEGERRTKIPLNSIKNRAAYAALLSGSPKLTELYQGMVDEGVNGVDYTRQGIMQQVTPQAEADAKSGALQILADPSIPDDKKRQVIASLNDGFIKDSATILANSAYAAASKGESVEAENVRISGAEQFRSMQEYKQLKQGIHNRFNTLAAQQGTGSHLVDFFELLLPFSVNKHGYSNLTKIAEAMGMEVGKLKATALPGSTYADIAEAWKKMPVEKRTQVLYKLSQAIENSDGIILPGDNKFTELMDFDRVVNGNYSGLDKFLDNASGILDVFGLGLIRAAKSGVKMLTKRVVRTPENVEQKIVQRGIVDTSAPTAPLSVLRDANPEKASAALAAIVKSEGDEVAQAIAGTNRNDAIAAEMLPQPATVDGTIAAKIVDPDAALRNIEVDPEIKNAVGDGGGFHFTEAERRAAEAHVLNDIHNLKGLTALDNMTAVGLKGDKVTITGMFGNSHGGWQKAEEAHAQAKFALAEYGIKNENIQIYKKIDDEYVPIDLEEAKLADGNYIVGIDVNPNISPNMIGKMDELDVKWNFLDSYPVLRSQNAGSAANHLMTHASMLHPTITGSASVAVDTAVKIDKLFLEMHAKFSDEYTKLPKVRQEKLYEHLKEANEKGLALSDVDLVGKGFVAEEIDLIKQWRKNWDTHFYFENADVVRTMRNQNYHVFEDAAKGNKFYAKPIQKNGNIQYLYDPATDSVRTVSRLEMDQIYDAGGTFAEFRRPVKINGVDVEHMVVRNTPTEYLRSINDTDQILNYRPGYFQVGYKAPVFITEKTRVNGKDVWKAVEVAGSKLEADQILKRLATSSGKSGKKGEDFDYRFDVKDMKPDTDFYWDLQHASGRIAQRHRGKLLEDSTSKVGGFNGQYILDPVESAIRASRSLSGRIGMRDMLETHKARAMQQYGEFFPEENGIKKWVENSNSLVKPGDMDSKRMRDARTTVEYINFLQRGYDNALDDTFKAGMNTLAKLAYHMDFKKGEEFFLWAKTGRPVELLKSGVFQAYLALNPARQFLVQGHQSIRLLGYNPTYMLSGKATLDAANYFKYASGLSDISKAPRETKEMIDFIQKSGMLDAVDKHNLVRGSLTDMAYSPNIAQKAIGKGLEYPRRIGFDAGERASLISHLLAVRDKYVKAGKDLSDPYIRDEAYSLARAMSYDMNRAGDMPYNSNALGLVFQFLQVPHKAFSAITTNRRIPGKVKVQMAAMDMLLFGIPGGAAIYSMLPKESLPDTPEAREYLEFGLTSIAYNKIFSTLAGKETKVDVSSLSPYNAEGFGRLYEAVMSGGMEEFFSRSPSFTFYFNEGSRMREALSSMARYATGHIDKEKAYEPNELVDVAKAWAELSSGWSNAMKANFILTTGKLKDKHGNHLAQDLNWVHAMAQAFGLPPMEVKLNYDAMKSMNKEGKEMEAEVNSFYKSHLRILTREHKLSNDDPEFQDKMLGAALMQFEDNPKAMQIIRSNLARDIVDMPDKITKAALERAGLTNLKDNQHVRNLKMLNNEDYEKLMKLLDDMEEQANQLGE